MLAAYAEKLGLPDPIDGVVVGERSEPIVREGWEVLDVRAASLNLHDIWLLRGAVPGLVPPVTLGSDVAGVTKDGREVIAHAVLDVRDRFHLLSDGVDGALAERVAVPSCNLIAKPESLSWEEATCLPTAWLTAWHMLFTRGRLLPGERVLVQGASGGVSTAAVMLAARAGAHVTVTSRNADSLERARQLGAHDTFPTGAELPQQVDLVVETVGAATWEHSLRALRYGGRVVTAGVTTGGETPFNIRRISWSEIDVLGAKMGSLQELRALCAAVVHTGIRPPISKVYAGLSAVPEALRDLAEGRRFGKLVIRVS